MKDLRIELKFKNERLYQAIQAEGGAPKFSKACGLSYGIILDLLHCRVSPKTLIFAEHGSQIIDWKPSVKIVAEYVGMNPEELFPEAIYPELGLKRPSYLSLLVDSTRLLPLSDVKQLPSGSDPEQDLMREERLTLIKSAIDQLTPREQMVITARYGFGGQWMTNDEIASEMGVSRERIRQIESKALRKLRHPSRTRKLKVFCESR